MWSGDLGWRDEQGYLHISGRKTDMIISGGFNVYPAELERVIGSHPNVDLVAVVGAAHPEWGETPVAVIVAKGDVAPEQMESSLRELCREQLAGYKQPRAYEFRTELPLGPAGKVLKREIRETLTVTPAVTMSLPALSLPATSVWQLVARRAAADPDRVLVMDEKGGELTFGALRDRAEVVAAGLQALGVGAGDVVSWQLPSRIDTIVLCTALARLDVVQNPLIAMLRRSEVEFICTQAGTKLLIVPSVFRGFDHLSHGAGDRRGRCRVWPCGTPTPGCPRATRPRWPLQPIRRRTTARPPPAGSSTHRARPPPPRARSTPITASSPPRRPSSSTPRCRPDDRTASLSPMAHVGGVLHVLSALSTGSRIVITEIFDPASTPDQMAAAEVTLGGSGVPFVQVYLRRQREAPQQRLFPTARAFLVGGAPRPVALALPGA